jgi:hypothetical protein
MVRVNLYRATEAVKNVVRASRPLVALSVRTRLAGEALAYFPLAFDFHSFSPLTLRPRTPFTNAQN